MSWVLGSLLFLIHLTASIDSLPPTQPPGETTVAAQTSSSSLSLADVLRTAETGHPKLRGAVAEQQAAEGKRLSKQGAFDPALIATGDFLRYNSSSTRGKETTANMTTVSLEAPLRSGVKLIAGANWNAGTVKSPLSSAGSTGEYYLGVKVPLLRDFRINEKATAERQAEFGVTLAGINFDAVRLDILREASLGYWDWVAAGQRATVARDLLRIAEERARQVRTRAERGDIPQIEVVEAEGEVQRRQGALVKAERDERKAAFKLYLYLWETPGAQATPPGVERLPAGIPTPEPLADDAVAEAAARAVQRRPELRAVSVVRQNFALDLRLARNDLKPNVDLVFQPGQDTGNLSVGGTLKAGVLFSVPLNRWEAAGRRDEAQAKLDKLEQEQILLTRQVQTEVADAATAVRATLGRYEAARQEVELAARLEEGERRRYALGDSTLFLVNQRERATAEARSRLIDVTAEYHQAIAQFRAASADF